MQGFITDHERALEDLFGDEETSRKGDACLNVMASRIATVFASLRVPLIILTNGYSHGMTLLNHFGFYRNFQQYDTALQSHLTHRQ